MQLQSINVPTLDEDAIFRFRWTEFETFLSEIEGSVGIKNNVTDDDTELDAKTVSILNLPSLKQGIVASALSPREKLNAILSDKERLSSWIDDYKYQINSGQEKDSVKVATFIEAGTRLMMLLDHSDFDEGELRIQRRAAIEDIKKMLKEFNLLK